jgi:hypothetical protein
VIASFLSSENQRGESIIRRDKPPMLPQSQSVAQQSPPPEEKKRKFLSDGFRADPLQSGSFFDNEFRVGHSLTALISLGSQTADSASRKIQANPSN